MLPLNFDFVWKYIILKSIDSFVLTLSKEQIDRYCVQVRDLKTLKTQINKDYESQKSLFKKRYHDASISSGRIDEHKIAACICYALVKNKVISYKLTEDLPPYLLLANYTIAYNSSAGIIFGFLLDYYISNGEKGKYMFLKNEQTLFLPKTTEKHDGYDACIIKMLALNDLYGNPVDLLAYSNIMFSLEEYNKSFIDNQDFG